MAIDLSQFSNEDLLALKNKDLSKISNQGLMLLKNASDPTIPTPSADDGRQERKLNLFQKGVNTIADVLDTAGLDLPELPTLPDLDVPSEFSVDVNVDVDQGEEQTRREKRQERRAKRKEERQKRRDERRNN